MKLKDSNCPSRKELDKALTYIDDTDIQYGDLVVFKQHAGYRNEGVVIYDGEKLIDLYADIDDYGSVPPKFKVLQKNKYGVDIGLHHWHNINNDSDWTGIDHNLIVWFDQTKHIDELTENLSYDKKLFGIYALYTHLINHNKEKIYIVILYQEIADSNSYLNEKTYKLKKESLVNFKKIVIQTFSKKNVSYECMDFEYYTNDNVSEQKLKNNSDKTILYLRYFDE
jgi:hypothetical protein